MHADGAFDELDDLRKCLPPPHRPLAIDKRPVPLLSPHELEVPPAARRRLAVQRQLGLAPPWRTPYRAVLARNETLAAALQGGDAAAA